MKRAARHHTAREVFVRSAKASKRVHVATHARIPRSESQWNEARPSTPCAASARPFRLLSRRALGMITRRQAQFVPGRDFARRFVKYVEPLCFSGKAARRHAVRAHSPGERPDAPFCRDSVPHRRFTRYPPRNIRSFRTPDPEEARAPPWSRCETRGTAQRSRRKSARSAHRDGGGSKARRSADASMVTSDNDFEYSGARLVLVFASFSHHATVEDVLIRPVNRTGSTG